MMFNETESDITVMDYGYCVIHARRRADATGKRVRVTIEPEEWERDDVEQQAW